MESQGRKESLPRKLPLLLIQLKWTFLPNTLDSFINFSYPFQRLLPNNGLLPGLIHSVKKKRKEKKMCACSWCPRPGAGGWDAIADGQWSCLQELRVLGVRWVTVNDDTLVGTVMDGEQGGKKEGQMNGQIERRKPEELSSSPDKSRKAFQGKWHTNQSL